MRTVRVVAAVALSFLLPCVAEATVIIYKGAGKIMRGNAVKSKVVNTSLFFVIDFDTLVGNFVFIQNVDGVKSVYDDGSRNYGIADVAAKPKPTVFFTSADGTFVATNNFQFRSFRMRGIKRNVFLTPTAPLPATIPRTVSGSYSVTNGTPVAIDGNFTMTVQLNRTHFSNANNLTVPQAVTAIVNSYIAKGYVNTFPNP